MLLWLNPFSGISGDMLLGALIDLGASADEIRDAVAVTGIEGWQLDAERVDAGGIMATRATVTVDPGPQDRRAGDLLDLVERAECGRDVAVRAVGAIAEVEGRLHGTPPEDVHLHEVGGIDTVVDTVGVAAAIELLGVERVLSAPPAVGAGTVDSAHGRLPVPAPATAALLAGVPIHGGDADVELVTPTGAALLRALDTDFGSLPPFTVEATGYGAGRRQLPDRPNVLPASLGRTPESASTAVVLETNVDDVTGEVLAHVVQRALDAGAHDAWITPIVMKKGRPAHTVHVLAAVEAADELSRLLLAETGSLGLRRHAVDKVVVPREVDTVEVRGHPVRIKRGPWGAKPEHEDLVRLAAALGVPLRVATALALDQHRRID